MIVYGSQNGEKKKKPFGQHFVDELYDYADRYKEKPGRLAREQQDRQFGQRADLAERMFAADQEASHARQLLEQEEAQYVRGERERQERQRGADAELSRLLVEEARGSTRPTAESSPTMAALGMLGRGLSRITGIKSLDPDQRMAAEENRRWDRFEKLAPTLSEDGRRALFQHLSRESEERVRKAQYGALARRLGQLQMPVASPGGAELPGLNPEDPEQAELIGNLQGMIDAGEDPEKINETISKLEGEVKRDRQQAIKREGVQGRMNEALATPPSFASQDEIDAAHALFLDFQTDPTRDAEDAWNEFRSTLYGGRDRWREATEYASRLTMRDDGLNPPRLPTEGEILDAGALLFPHDPRFMTDINRFPESRVQQGAGQPGPAAQPSPGSPGVAGPRPSMPFEAEAQQPFQGYSTEFEGGQPGAQGPSAPAPRAGAAPVSPEMRAAREKITTPVMTAMIAGVSQAKTLQEANAAIAREAKKAGIPVQALPEWLLKSLGTQFMAGHPSQEGESRAEAQRSKEARAPADELLRASRGDPAAQESLRAYRESRKSSSEFLWNPKTKSWEKAGGEQSGGEQSGNAPSPSSEAPEKAEPKVWKRLSPEEQKAARGELVKAIESATRFDFHGALAPTLRALGIDLGSLPKKDARMLREELRKKRQQSLERRRSVGG